MTTLEATRAAFLADIIAHPQDDTPRLIFADWLEEQGGDPLRAEFVRVQCRIAHLDMGGGQLPMGVGREELLRRERDLLFDHWPRWLHDAFDGMAFDVGCSARDDNDYGVSLYSPEPNRSELGHFDCSFRRGFVAEVGCRCEDWLRHGPALVRAAPLTEVTLPDRVPETSRQGVRGLRKPFWYLDSGDIPSDRPPTRHWIPRSLAEHLTGGTPLPTAHTTVFHAREYDTPELALADLSSACLKWARATEPHAVG